MTQMSHIGLKKLYEQIRNIPGQEYVDIPRTERTPEIILDKSGEVGRIKFIGRSLPDDARTFYRPILTWIEDYFNNPHDTTIISFDLEYFNTSSSKMLLQIIRKFQKLEDQDKEIKVEWYYLEDDEDILESGVTFQDLTSIDFEFISYQ
jgi:hypothetical protein